MPEEVVTLVRIPLLEIEQWVRLKHVLPRMLVDFRIEENCLVLYFSEDEASDKSDIIAREGTAPKRRKARRKRNRMKTRGWEVVARITNSKGQKCSIYRPFVDALSDLGLAPDEQKRRVERILRLNRNRPSEVSTQYFLDNTIEYIRGRQASVISS